jgi:hypothetical protein
LLRFLSVYAKTQANASATHDIRSSCCLPSLLGDMQVAQHTFHIIDVNVAESVRAHRAYDAGPEGAGPGQIKPKISTLKALLKGELDALQSRILLLSSKPFNKYPGISWPLEFGADPSENNLESFNVIGKMPVVTRTSRESLSSMADLSDLMFEGISKAEEKAKLARAALRRIGSMGGAGSALDDDEEPDTELTELQRAEGQVRAAEAAIAEIQRAIEQSSVDIPQEQIETLRQQLATATQRAADLRAVADAARQRHAGAAARRRTEEERRGVPRTNVRV